MKGPLAVFIFAAFAAIRLSAIDANFFGRYKAEPTGSRLELDSKGRFALESTGEVRVWFLGGHWKIEGDVLVLSWGEEIARYAIKKEGALLTLIVKAKGSSLVEQPDVVLAQSYEKEPNQ